MWELSESAVTDASPQFAWAFMSNVANWNDPPASFELDGPFTSGTWGTTRTPGQEPRRWRLSEVNAPESYVVEMPLDGAVIRCEWRFEGVDGGRTRLTQRISLSGENAAAYLEPVRAAFTSTLAAGMARIAAEIGRSSEQS